MTELVRKPASATVAGVVTTNDQTFSGVKIFADGLQLNSSSNGNVNYGTFTPTVTNVQFFSPGTVLQFNYIRIGSKAMITGAFSGDLLGGANDAIIRVDLSALPFVNNFTNNQQASGTAGMVRNANPSLGGITESEASSKFIRVRMQSSSALSGVKITLSCIVDIL